jgi:uncharacterized protein YggE
MNHSAIWSRLAWVTGAIAAAALGGCAHRDACCARATPGGAPAHMVTVVGQGEVSHAPDLARVNLGVDVAASTVAEATRMANQRMASLLAALKQSGVADKDLQTSNLSIRFERTQDQPMPTAPRPAPAGAYHVSNTVRATIRSIDRVGPVLDAAVAAGANELSGISFDIDKPEALQAEARAKAIADAHARAEALVKLAGRDLGEVLSITDSDAGAGRPMPVGLRMTTAMGEFSGAVTPGEVAVNARIEVAYRIK